MLSSLVLSFSSHFPSILSNYPWLTFMLVLGLAMAVFGWVWMAIIVHRQRRRRAELRESAYKEEFIPSAQFERDWIVGGSRGRSAFTGYKYEDGPGCYIILIFDSPVEDGDYSGYENVYIGQSVNVCQRVHNHFNGKGNGDVYADVRNGKSVYVQFKRCDKADMNRIEKELIDAFDATSSYNNTRGGGVKR